MKTFLTLFASAALTLSASAYADTPPTSLSEGFDNVASLSGWTINGSAATASWFQGNGASFAAQSGAATSYIASNFLASNLSTGAIDNWLITPEITLATGSRLTFFTRDSNEGSEYHDTLRVLFSSGSGTATSGFTTELLAIGNGVAYPHGWTQYTVDLTGTGTGRIAFNYTGNYDTASYIGIDSVAVSVSAVPEPSAWLMMGLGLAGVGFMARRSRRAAAGVALATLGMSAMAAEPQPVKESGMVVVRDAETGALRAPTPAEYRALVPQAAASRESRLQRGVPAAAQQVRTLSNGAESANVEHKAVYSVLTRNADGTTSEACVTGDAAATAMINHPRTTQAKDSHYEAQ